jgi:hypothetical protein
VNTPWRENINANNMKITNLVLVTLIGMGGLIQEAIPKQRMWEGLSSHELSSRYGTG